MKEQIELLRSLVNGGDDACLKGTPMIPLHKGTVATILDELERQHPASGVPSRICAYPLPGWRLAYVQYDDNREGQPDGWIVKLVRETTSWHLNRRETNVMARSDMGPLEAWDEALQIALRSDQREAEREAQRAASAMSAGTAETQSGSGPKDRQRDPKGDAQ